MGTSRVSYTTSVAPTTRFEAESDIAEVDADYGDHGRWRVRSYLTATNLGNTSSAYNGSGTQYGRLNATQFGFHSGTPFLPGGVGTGVQRWDDGPWDRWITANANGYWTSSSTSLPIVMRVDFGTIDETVQGALPMPRIARAPGAPATVSISDLTPVSATFSWTAAPRGNADITAYQWQIATNSGFSAVVHTETLGVTLTDSTIGDVALNPGTGYYVRVRAINGDGNGAWSSGFSFTTLPSSPPTLTSVTPDATGAKATLVMAPPGGISAVDSYTIQRRAAGGSWTTVASGSANPTQTVTGLTPGQTYEWRVLAVIGTYTSPESNVITVTQPQPNASPGAFFDGDTPDSASSTYDWTGTAGASTSTATTQAGGAIGWLDGTEAVVDSGGTAVQYQIAGGLEPNGNSGAYSVRYAMLTPATSNGFRAGTDGEDGYAMVTVGGVYMGSMWVQSSRTRDLAPMLVWYDSGGNEIGTTLGGTTSVVAGAPIRLYASGPAPAGAEKAAVVITDPPGSLMMDAGDSLDVDAAMASIGTLYPYFDGDTADTSLFMYDWTGAQYISTSARTAIPQDDQDPLQDPDCPAPPAPPRPPIVDDDCITPVGSWRRAWYQINAINVPTYLNSVPTIRLTTFGESEGQVRIRWYENPLCLAPADIDSTEWDYEQIISYIPANSTLILDGVTRRVTAEVPTGSNSIPADSLLYGTNGVPASWPVLTCGECWLASVDTPLTATAGNLTIHASVTIRE